MVCMHVLVSLAQGINKYWPCLFSVKIQNLYSVTWGVNIVNTNSVIPKRKKRPYTKQNSTLVRTTKEASFSFKNNARNLNNQNRGHCQRGWGPCSAFSLTSWRIFPASCEGSFSSQTTNQSSRERPCLKPLWQVSLLYRQRNWGKGSFNPFPGNTE